MFVNMCILRQVLTTVKDSYPATDSRMMAQGKLLYDIQVEAYCSQSVLNNTIKDLRVRCV
jgi:hypothetical protein